MPTSLFKICLALAAILFFSQHAVAQVWINGHLQNKLTHKPIEHGEIRTPLSSAISDSNGHFRIRVRESDIVSMKATNYKFDTIHFSFSLIDSVLLLELEPMGASLQNVTITTIYSPYQLDSINRRRSFEEGRSKTTFIDKHPHQGFGLIMNLDRIGKSPDKGLVRQRQLFEKTEEWHYIRTRFPDSLVRFYTGLHGDSLRRFIYAYTPTYEWLRAHPSKMEVVMYINDKMKLFGKK
jgi:hypothetical protein